ncbi:MotA/TolQ/ExbB proton channel family protein [Phaeodactylibacter sp.]|uniref:MotA/TolQ/ExbB proton channel family protein n=1 Tax=Phaeodactylibacter sp. TaxID=1940289 RepID=UPI0025DC7881|nr:MotA/TolQ/ExbB proton channel family protein [Phaeodactylibacter sp.]MCI4650644.1 MotA/TolQ/ExbB proton channel family protein [Phaeodactylibacter sp.]MCI5094145.1 MotA/TolQ/ExbB proton channel family protein [Phaeodactylibacter sp.]
MKSGKLINLLISLVAAIVFGLIVYGIGSVVSEESGAYRLLELMGANLPSGFIQILTYFLFLYGILEILRMNRQANLEEHAFSLGLLPEQEQYVLSAEDVAQIKLKMVELGRGTPYLLVETIKRACTQFRANKSVAETLDVVSAHTNLLSRNSDSEQALIRYVAWAIPSIGFIGTVIGIASSLGAANQVTTQEGIKAVTSLLNVAFDTTLVALILSIVLMFFYHLLQERVEKLHANIEDYVMENLVNRIYHREPV